MADQHMHICYLSSSDIPSRAANSIHVMKMCHALAQAGHRIELVAKSGDPLDGDVFAHYGIAPGFAIVRCKRPHFRKLLGDVQFARDVARLVRERPWPQLFFARHIYSLACVAALHIPMMFEAHTPPVNVLQRAVEAWVFRQPHFVRLIVISNALKSEYRRLFPWLPTAKILVAHDAADPYESPADRPPDANWPGRSGALQVGYVGHLYPGRGIGLMVSLARRLPEADFHLVGGMDQDIQRWKQVNSPNNLFFHGFVAPRHLSRYYARFDLMLAPYQQRVLAVGRKKEISRWMSPLKIFDYMAAGKAMVCADLPVLREVLTHEVNCWLAPSTDLEAWCQAISTLRDDSTLRDALGARARSDFDARHTWKQRATTVLAGLV
jgi:glycosyltransferase involved in cell wall biosynthesis